MTSLNSGKSPNKLVFLKVLNEVGLIRACIVSAFHAKSANGKQLRSQKPFQCFLRPSRIFLCAPAYTAGRLCMNLNSQNVLPSNFLLRLTYFWVPQRHQCFFLTDSTSFSRLKKKVKVFATFVVFKFTALHSFLRCR